VACICDLPAAPPPGAVPLLFRPCILKIALLALPTHSSHPCTDVQACPTDAQFDAGHAKITAAVSAMENSNSALLRLPCLLYCLHTVQAAIMHIMHKATCCACRIDALCLNLYDQPHCVR
jgi:hypothetical protein